MATTALPASLHTALDRLPLSEPAERTDFTWELLQLLSDPRLARLVQSQLLPDLLTLYRQQTAAATIMENTLRELVPLAERSARLVDYFTNLLTPAGKLPVRKVALHTLSGLAVRAIQPATLGGLLAQRVLDQLAVVELHILRRACPAALTCWVQYRAVSASLLPADLERAALSLIVDHLSPGALAEERTPARLYRFLSTILPLFVRRLGPEATAENLAADPARLARWYRTWEQHARGPQTDSNLEAAYCATDFATVVRNVPAHLWWNNGIGYGVAGRQYSSESAGFHWLAVGGSVRHNPADYRPYTRRMARLFVNWAEPAGPLNSDAYLTMFARSLGAGPQLVGLLARFMRLPVSRDALQQQLDRWNPVVQKLATPAFEELDPHTATQLLGYLYHCLRDQADFRVTRRSLAQLLRDATAYYDRIECRRLMLQGRMEARRRRQYRNVAEGTWEPQAQLQQLIETYPSYLPVRKRTIVELLSEAELRQEGRVMGHCVGTYGQWCQRPHSSIWSLRELGSDGVWRSIVTLQVHQNRIVQARGRLNAQPPEDRVVFIDTWARKNRLQF